MRLQLRQEAEPLFKEELYAPHSHHDDEPFGIKGSNRWAKERKASPSVYVLDDRLCTLANRAAKRCPEISINRDIMGGQPCITGTRIPVKAILRAIEQSGSLEGVAILYPSVNGQQVKDALYFSQLILELPGDQQA